MQEQRQERNGEHKEDANDATLDPIEHGVEVVASRLASVRLVALVLANRELLIESTEEDHWKYAEVSAILTKKIARHSRHKMNTCTDKMTKMLLIWNPGWP